MDRFEFLKWRRDLRYTQAKAAVELGVNRGTIRNWERGATRIPRTVALACHELDR
jgi:DNA-binding XRE family transcriptional regulator